MKTRHRVHLADARDLGALEAESVHLAVTSPPYPMIEMWDEAFARQDPRIARALAAGDGRAAFERMHALLDRVWRELWRVLVPGGIACVDVGDATRTVAGRFALWSNHSRILRSLLELGFSALPSILWRKPTNAPNKFMGSGMLAPGAYVTLEHEHILVVRKGDKRLFRTEPEKANRRASAYFWQERNDWFSDVWFDLPGERQEIASREARARSGAFPLELPWRLLHMFSVRGDTVLDPFLGVGTTMLAAMASGRSSVGYEIDASLAPAIRRTLGEAVEVGRARARERLERHEAFVAERRSGGGSLGHQNGPHGVPVVTRQERELHLFRPRAAREVGKLEFEVELEPAGAEVAADRVEPAPAAPRGRRRAP